jgi:hypothetical protein
MIFFVYSEINKDYIYLFEYVNDKILNKECQIRQIGQNDIVVEYENCKRRLYKISYVENLIKK